MLNSGEDSDEEKIFQLFLALQDLLGRGGFCMGCLRLGSILVVVVRHILTFCVSLLRTCCLARLLWIVRLLCVSTVVVLQGGSSSVVCIVVSRWGFSSPSRL